MATLNRENRRMRSRQVMITHTAGPGDVLSTYRHWVNGVSDPHEVSETYSGQFYELIRALSFRAHVISSHPRKEIWKEDWITIEHRPNNCVGKSGLSYHLNDIWYCLGLIRSMIAQRSDIAVIGDVEHWWLFSLLPMANIKVIGVLHCTFWPKGFRSSALKDRILGMLNAWFWRRVPLAVICISPECERQVRELAGVSARVCAMQARPLYHRGYFDTVETAAWDSKPFVLLFAGRIERNKGIFDLLDVAERLRETELSEFVFEVCGSGGAEADFVSEIERRQLSSQVSFSGRLNRDQMRRAFERAHAVIVPTTAGFAEGLNQVIVEGVLSGRPVIASDICPAVELVGQAAIAVPAAGVSEMAKAIHRLATDREYYFRVQASCRENAEQFYDTDMSWGVVLGNAIQFALTEK